MGKEINNKTEGCDFINTCNDAMENEDCKKYFSNCAKYEIWKKQGGP